MQIVTYRNHQHIKTSRLGSLAIIALLMFTLTSCKKEKDPVPPSVSLTSGSAYTPNGAIVAVGRPISFGITATAADANITNLVVKKVMPDGSVKVMLDSGLNSTGFTIDKIFYQSIEEEAKWTIQIMDKNRLFATTAITIYRDPNSSWGGIFEFDRIVMGYQDNAVFGHFLVPSEGKVYFADSATFNQTLIDLALYYYDDAGTPSPTLSSPGETGGGIMAYYPELENWTTLRFTKYDISVDGDPVPVATFDGCHNDSALILSYDDVWGKRKFKWADAGKVIPFMTAAGKKGLIRVLSADHDPAGKMEFALKIQQ